MNGQTNEWTMNEWTNDKYIDRWMEVHTNELTCNVTSITIKRYIKNNVPISK